MKTCFDPGETGCIALISAPSDLEIYAAFRAVAQKRKVFVKSERLWLERGVPIAPGFSAGNLPSLFVRLFTGARAMIARIELVVDVLRIEFIRSGGHPPHPESFFDEVRMTIEEQTTPLDEIELAAVIQTFFAKLHVNAVTASPPFARIFNVKPLSIASLKDRIIRAPSNGDGESMH